MQETNRLIDKRWNYRLYGGLLIVVAAAGLMFALYLVFQALSGPVGRHGFEPGANDFYLSSSVPLIKNGSPTPMLSVWGVAFGLIGLAGALLLSKARGITREVRETEAEVSRWLRVEESLMNRGRAQGR